MQPILNSAKTNGTEYQSSPHDFIDSNDKLESTKEKHHMLSVKPGTPTLPETKQQHTNKQKLCMDGKMIRL